MLGFNWLKGTVWVEWFTPDGVARSGENKLNEMKIMQYSGLKDRYGKEIYEGDIIKNESGEGYDILSVVAYKKGVFCIDANDELDYIEYPLYEWNCEAEVIGNIYENPELLEGETNV